MSLVESLIKREIYNYNLWLAEAREQNGQLQEQMDANVALITQWEAELAELESL